jgi:hypothetical protein
VYLDEPIILDQELLEVSWGAEMLVLQFLRVDAANEAKPEPLAAANATALRRPPLQIVCRKATTAFEFRYGSTHAGLL